MALWSRGDSHPHKTACKAAAFSSGHGPEIHPTRGGVLARSPGAAPGTRGFGDPAALLAPSVLEPALCGQKSGHPSSHYGEPAGFSRRCLGRLPARLRAIGTDSHRLIAFS